MRPSVASFRFRLLGEDRTLREPLWCPSVDFPRAVFPVPALGTLLFRRSESLSREMRGRESRRMSVPPAFSMMLRCYRVGFGMICPVGGGESPLSLFGPSPFSPNFCFHALLCCTSSSIIITPFSQLRRKGGNNASVAIRTVRTYVRTYHRRIRYD